MVMGCNNSRFVGISKVSSSIASLALTVFKFTNLLKVTAVFEVEEISSLRHIQYFQAHKHGKVHQIFREKKFGHCSERAKVLLRCRG
jgi:hemerythrin